MVLSWYPVFKHHSMCMVCCPFSNLSKSMLSCDDLCYLVSYDKTTEIISYCGIQSKALDNKKDRYFYSYLDSMSMLFNSDIESRSHWIKYKLLIFNFIQINLATVVLLNLINFLIILDSVQFTSFILQDSMCKRITKVVKLNKNG